MSQIKSVLFDLDGTLLNTLDDLRDSVNFALEQNSMPTHSLEAIRSFVGNGVQVLMERAVPGGKDNPLFQKAYGEFKNHYSEHMRDKTAPYEGIIPMLEKLKSEGFKIGVVSNKFDSAVKALCEEYFGSLVDVAVGESEKVKRKPAPDTIFEALSALGFGADEVVFAGDSEVDIETANNARVRCISVTWGFRTGEFLLNHGAREMVDTPSEITELIAAERN